MTIRNSHIARGAGHRTRLALLCLLLVLVNAAAPPAQAQQGLVPATLVQPSDGSFFNPSQAIRWTPQPGALAYYLYVGTAPGLKDIINSGETPLTEWPAVKLPAGATIHARIHTRYEAGWAHADTTFSVQPVAVLTSPASSVVSGRHTFQWTTVPDAEAYYLYVGSEPGLRDIVNTGEIPATSYEAMGLPAGQTVYARLHTKQGGQWRVAADRTLQVLPVSTFIAPLDGARGVDPEQRIRWQEVDGAEAYYLYVGTAPGLKDIVNTGETLATSWPATFIPAGQTVFARLHTKFNGAWRYTDISFELTPKAVFIEPATDGLDVDPRAPIMWTDVPSALAYYLYVGSAPGGKDIVNSGEIQSLSFDISSLPRNQTMYATLHTKGSDGWRYVQRTFQIVGIVATFVDRPDAPSSVDVRAPLQWVGVEGAQAYRLTVGTVPGSNDLIDSGETLATQFPIEALPAGRTVHARLLTKHGNVWRHVDLTFTTRDVAYLNGPPAASGEWQASIPLTWTPVPGAELYYAYVGSTPGALDISSSGAIPGTEFTMPAHHAAAIGSDRTVYVRLYTFKDGRWQYVDYELVFRIAASLTFPMPGATGIDVISFRMTWPAIESAPRYRLQLGTAPGADDILSTGDIHSPVYRVNSLPGGRTVFARLWTEISGQWRYSDSSFSTKPVATLLSPAFGEARVDLEQPLLWSAVEGASSYRVEIGSISGANDLFDSGPISSTSVPMPASVTAESGVVFVRVWTRHEDKWRFTDSIFSTAQADDTTMDWVSGKDAFHSGHGFRWTASPLVEWFRLRIGTAPGGDDLHDSGRIRATRRLVENLPEGVELHGSVESAYYDGSTRIVQFQFSVEDASIDFADRWEHALWITAAVRNMAVNRNVPLPDSLLLDFARMQELDVAFCTTFSLAFVELARHMNLGANVRRLSVCLNTNSYDCHSLNEVFNPLTGRWQLLDPTFGMAMRRSGGGEWLTSSDMLEATRDGTFDAVEYVPLTINGLSYAEDYYLDYPLLFAKILAPESNTVIYSMGSVLHFYEFTGATAVYTPGLYAIRCLGSENQALILADGIATAFTCREDANGLSHVFAANALEPMETSPPYEIAIPRRFVFD